MVALSVLMIMLLFWSPIRMCLEELEFGPVEES